MTSKVVAEGVMNTLRNYGEETHQLFEDMTGTSGDSWDVDVAFFPASVGLSERFDEMGKDKPAALSLLKESFPNDPNIEKLSATFIRGARSILRSKDRLLRVGEELTGYSFTE